MSNSKNEIRAFFESRKAKLKLITISDDIKAKVKKLSLAELEKIQFDSNDLEKNIALIESLYFSADTEEPLFDKEYLRNIANEDLIELYLTAIKANGANEKEIEKN